MISSKVVEEVLSCWWIAGSPEKPIKLSQCTGHLTTNIAEVVHDV